MAATNQPGYGGTDARPTAGTYPPPPINEPTTGPFGARPAEFPFPHAAFDHMANPPEVTGCGGNDFEPLTDS
jgi:hypothetical protein